MSMMHGRKLGSIAKLVAQGRDLVEDEGEQSPAQQPALGITQLQLQQGSTARLSCLRHDPTNKLLCLPSNHSRVILWQNELVVIVDGPACSCCCWAVETENSAKREMPQK